MLKKILIVIALILMGITAFQTQRACRLGKQYQKITAEYNTFKKDVSAREQASLQHVADMEAEIQQYQEENDSIATVIVGKDNSIATLKNHAKLLEDQYATIKDMPSQIVNLKDQVASWKAAFTLSEEKSVEKDKIIFNLTAQYQDQLKISLNYKTMYEDQKALVTKAELRIKVLESITTVGPFAINLGSGVWGAVGFAVGLLLHSIFIK